MIEQSGFISCSKFYSRSSKNSSVQIILLCEFYKLFFHNYIEFIIKSIPSKIVAFS